MADATEIRVGNVVRVEGKKYKVLSTEIRGTGKFGKTVHAKIRNLEDGNIQEKSWRAEDKVETVEVQYVKMQYLYRESDQFYFMNMTNYEQYALSAQAVGKQEMFLKENLEINVLFAENKPITLEFPRLIELKVVSSPQGVKGGGDSTYKEVELENGLKILAPQFIKEGEAVRVSSDDLSYVERVPVKSLK